LFYGAILGWRNQGMGKGISKSFLLFVVLVMAGGGAAAVLGSWNYFLRENISILESEILHTASGFAAAVGKLNADARNLNAVLASTKQDLAIAVAQRDNIGLQYNDAVEKYNQEKSRMDALNSQIGQIQGSVDTLEKLKATDEELLKKYSKIYFLNENYIPESFSAVDPEYGYKPDGNYLVNSKIWPFLKVLMVTAKADDIDMKIISAYRSFGEQTSLKSSYKIIYGTGANKFSADQGYSEHQLGTTVDFTTSQIGSSFDGFEDSASYKWLQENAYQFGFVISYPKNNQYYQYEPWHWRFVGRELAKKLHEEGKNFYDLDQREIDQYLISFFD
jgi:D-alanyl-D-alanine carboxypeptidase